jgi:hypothetical protein
LLYMSFTGEILSPVSTLTRNTCKSKPAAFSGSYKYAPNFKSHTSYVTQRKRESIKVSDKTATKPLQAASTLLKLQTIFCSIKKLRFALYKGAIVNSEH